MMKEHPGFERWLSVIGIPAMVWILFLNGPDDWTLVERVRTALLVTVLWVPLMYGPSPDSAGRQRQSARLCATSSCRGSSWQ